jgi:ABC-type sugar transport system permease subunit
VAAQLAEPSLEDIASVAEFAEVLKGGADSVTKTIGPITVAMHRVNMSEADEDTGYLTVGLGNVSSASLASAVAVFLPASLVAKAGAKDFVVLLSVVAEEGTSNATNSTNDEWEKAAPVISVRILDKSGSHLHFEGLDPPVLIHIADEAPADATCVFWDDTLGQWSGVGVTRQPSVNGSLVCAATHLSVFSFVKGFEQFFLCLQGPELLTAKALKRLGEGTWWYEAPALLLWFILLFQFAVVCQARSIDTERTLKPMWFDEFFFIDRPKVKGSKTKSMERLDDVRAMWSNPWDRFSLEATSFFAHLLTAAQHKISIGDMKLLLRWAHAKYGPELYGPELSASPCLTHLASVKSPQCAPPELRRQNEAARFAGKLAQDLQMMLDKLTRGEVDVKTSFAASFVSNEPWLQVLRRTRLLCMTRPAVDFAMLLTAKLMGCCLVATVIFSNGATDVKSDCEPTKDVWQIIGRTVASSLLSALISPIPILLMASLFKKRLMFRDVWDEKSKAKQLRKWAIGRVVLWAVVVLYASFSLICCCSFLANVKRKDAIEVILSALQNVFQKSLLSPVAMGMAAAAVLWKLAPAFGRLTADALNQVRKKLAIHDADIPEKESVDVVQAVPPAEECEMHEKPMHEPQQWSAPRHLGTAAAPFPNTYQAFKHMRREIIAAQIAKESLPGQVREEEAPVSQSGAVAGEICLQHQNTWAVSIRDATVLPLPLDERRPVPLDMREVRVSDVL